MSKKAPPAIIVARADGELADRELGAVVHAEHRVAGEALEQAVGEHRHCAPPRPSSAGWKMKWTVPSKLRVSARYFAAPSSMVVWPSWPQACITPLVVER
jgi:hypothetical protein